MAHFVSASCRGETCTFRIFDLKMDAYTSCGKPAAHKVGEEIPHDDPNPIRHNLTSYVCCAHFRDIVGPAAPCAF